MSPMFAQILAAALAGSAAGGLDPMAVGGPTVSPWGAGGGGFMGALIGFGMAYAQQKMAKKAAKAARPKAKPKVRK